MDLSAPVTAAPPEPRNAMADIETLGRRPFCPILSIGACTFHIGVDGCETDDPSKVIVDVFHQAITLESCLEVGLKIDADTLAWWMHGDRTQAARDAAFNNPQAVKLPMALDAFTDWLQSRPLSLWGNSARFDMGILEAAFVACGKSITWEWHLERCYRTIKNLPAAKTVELIRFGTHHNALDDAISQALHLRAINRALQLQL